MSHVIYDRTPYGPSSQSAEDRRRMAKLVRDLTSLYENVLTIHAEGSDAFNIQFN